mmetsp:Transcript_25939/g.54089  ORF Transcript_25939/g.54089 Transcript_25939/m.54089 type:complete len:203 (-) Transcript_25939:1419-2027(-)
MLQPPTMLDLVIPGNMVQHEGENQLIHFDNKMKMKFWLKSHTTVAAGVTSFRKGRLNSKESRAPIGRVFLPLQFFLFPLTTSHQFWKGNITFRFHSITCPSASLTGKTSRQTRSFFWRWYANVSRKIISLFLHLLSMRVEQLVLATRTMTVRFACTYRLGIACRFCTMIQSLIKWRSSFIWTTNHWDQMWEAFNIFTIVSVV